MSLAGRIVRGIGTWLPRPLLRPLEGPAAVFFHGVEINPFDPQLQSNHHRIEDLYEIALALKSDFDAAPLSALPEVLAAPGKHRRTVFLMSDDGYANTLTVAAHMLESLKLPWALFVSTQHIDTGERSPIFLARLFFRHAPDGVYPLPGFEKPAVLNGNRIETAKGALRRLRQIPAEQAKLAIRGMVQVLEKHGLAELLAQYRSDSFLDWDGVRALAQRGVTIGAHAHWHWPMHDAGAGGALKQQAELPRRRIEAEAGPCRHFAYPFGNAGDVCADAWRAVRDAGYDYAFTTLSGTLDGSTNRWLLPRYGLAPVEPNLGSTLRLLRLGNRRLAHWQRLLR